MPSLSLAQMSVNLIKRKVKHLAGFRKYPRDNYVFLARECPQRRDLSTSNAERDRWFGLLENPQGKSCERKGHSEVDILYLQKQKRKIIISREWVSLLHGM